MKQIYFSTDVAPSAGKRLLRATIENTTSAMSALLPELTLKMAEKVLCTPNRPQKGKSLGSDFSKNTIQVLGQEVCIYQKGNFDRSILFTHGWSGSAVDFSAFYESFLNSGYNVIAFDHVGHGQSSGQVANLFLFIKGLEAALKHTKDHSKLSGIVAHSMGGSATVSALADLEPQIPLALVAPVVPLFETLYDSVKSFGISRKWLDLLLRHFENRYSMQIPDIDPKNQIKKLQNPLLVIQDKKDSYIGLEMNKQFMPDRVKAALVETEGLGHFRILKSQDVIQKALEFINVSQN